MESGEKYNNGNLRIEWLKVVDFFIDLTGKKPADINNVLYTIGIQELGKGVQDFSKEEKQDLIHIGTCAVLTEYYRETHKDEDSWPHFEQIKEIPFLDLKEQVAFLRHHIIQYFYENDLIQ